MIAREESIWRFFKMPTIKARPYVPKIRFFKKKACQLLKPGFYVPKIIL